MLLLSYYGHWKDPNYLVPTTFDYVILYLERKAIFLAVAICVVVYMYVLYTNGAMTSYSRTRLHAPLMTTTNANTLGPRTDRSTNHMS